MTAKPATAAQKRRRDAILALGCIVGHHFGFHCCNGRPTWHHCGTGAGGRKDHDYTICLCWEHHQGRDGIDGQVMSKRRWQEKYATETILYELTERLLKEGEVL